MVATILTFSLLAFSLLVIILPRIRSPYWLFRIFDYPRPQTIALHAFSLFAMWLTYSYRTWTLLLGVIFLADIIRQASLILPFTRWGRKEVADFDEVYGEKARISLLHWNVYQENRQIEELLQHVEKWQPDIILLCETDQWWVDSLAVLREQYPCRIEWPLNNTYGMCLYAKYQWENEQVLFLVDEEVPSVKVDLILENEERVRIYAVHPIPPIPDFSTTTVERNAELLQIAQQVSAANPALPQLVLGDLNDVAWSKNTRRFKKLSRLADPRRGRGVLPTFPSNQPFLGVPIDQVFCSHHFQLTQLLRLPAMGSDHYPLYIDLVITERTNPNAHIQLKKPNEEDLRQAEALIEKA